ncbi:MAG: GbsR/MarR family transcriptional regulator, partial [Phycisphaerae bacterium]
LREGAGMRNTLTEVRNMLVRRWGEMSGYWGINRTMAEIHALLYISGEPLCTDDVMEQLQISRGNASMNLRALVDWGLIGRVHQLGDRKEYFQADVDVWRMFETIMRERRRREVEPIVSTIDRSLQMLAANPADLAGVKPEAIPAARRRLSELRRFLASMSTLFELVLRVGRDGIAELARLVDSAGGDSGDGAPCGSGGRSPTGAPAGPTLAQRGTRAMLAQVGDRALESNAPRGLAAGAAPARRASSSRRTKR